MKNHCELPPIERGSGNSVWPTDDRQPVFEFDSRKLRQQDRFDAWAAHVEHSVEIEPLSEGSAQHFAVSSAWSIGSLVVSHLACAPQVTRLRRPQHRQTDPEAIQVRIYHGGRSRGLSNGQPFETLPGEIHTFDMARSFYNETDGGAEFTAVFVPHAVLDFDPSRHRAHGKLVKDSAAARMISAATGALSETSHKTPLDVKKQLVDGYVGLIRSLVLGEMESEDSRRAIEATRQALLREYIEANLADPALSVDSVCHAFGASRATVYRDFSADGGIRRYVLGRRLEAARRDLEIGPDLRGRVRQVAEKWGFENPSHFNRAFREAFAASPSDFVAKAETNSKQS